MYVAASAAASGAASGAGIGEATARVRRERARRGVNFIVAVVGLG